MWSQSPTSSQLSFVVSSLADSDLHYYSNMLVSAGYLGAFAMYGIQCWDARYPYRDFKSVNIPDSKHLQELKYGENQKSETILLFYLFCELNALKESHQTLSHTAWCWPLANFDVNWSRTYLKEVRRVFASSYLRQPCLFSHLWWLGMHPLCKERECK